MLLKNLCLALAAAVAMLIVSPKAQAWGAYHVGYTHVGPAGVQHYGRTVGVGPYGVSSSARYGAYGANASYRTGAIYGAGAGSTYRYGYDRYGSYDRYSSYRRW